MSQEVVESESKCVHLFRELVASGLALLAHRPPAAQKKAYTFWLWLFNSRAGMLQPTSFFLPLFVLIERKKKGRKETNKNRWFTKIFLRWKCVIIIAWHFRACANSSKIGRLGNAQVRNTRLYELRYFRYCLPLPQSSSPKNNNFPSVLTLSLPNVSKGKCWPNFQISFCKILTNKYHHLYVQA